VVSSGIRMEVIGSDCGGDGAMGYPDPSTKDEITERNRD